MNAPSPESQHNISLPMLGFMIAVSIVLPIAGLAYGVVVIARGDRAIGAGMILIAIAATVGYIALLG